ncbi:DUF6879 family protein [Actinokineospora spheciospongiae]|uniref:DUF6879 family protein n=1 Tax=Actinokineospora spheciospongiae TaxID=909613 RepID=UPI002D767B0C|nr:DUF6879 family protein [Actinokineospora spheciospongiae]
MKRFLSLEDPDFGKLFTEFSYTAFRLEAQQVYDVSYEQDSYRRFLNGEPRGDSPSIASWVKQVTEDVADGKRFQRVHVVVEPLTDYLRFECAWSYRDTVAAGEDVRVIPLTPGAWPEEIPTTDYWLFDSSRLLRMEYDDAGYFQYAELVDDPDEIVQANLWRDRTLKASVPFAEFEKKFDKFMNALK